MEKPTFTLKSTDLGGQVTEKHLFSGMGCGGRNISPHLLWENPPEGTRSFAVTLHDPDAPTQSGFWHWAVYNIPAGITELKAGAGNPDNNALPEGSSMGVTDFGSREYSGPCPPEGDLPHRYIITIYALDTDKIEVQPDTPPALAIFQMVTGHLIARASIMSYYGR